ncbi:hypothetical protein V6N11_073503 [Hibiscus sabdariffa]|uniref:Uncharacterized protein n=1 Tax=Hibiscus sabdariffa TaxID=183260 RepID=A0ABR2NTN0_9ROSI
MAGATVADATMVEATIVGATVAGEDERRLSFQAVRLLLAMAASNQQPDRTGKEKPTSVSSHIVFSFISK